MAHIRSSTGADRLVGPRTDSDMIGQEVQLRITVRPSRSTPGHEVCLFGNDEDLIEIFGDESIGLDPIDLLITPCPLVAESTPSQVLIAQCSCGVLGCCDVYVNIVLEANVVMWSNPDTPSIRRTFDALRYHAEIARALRDHTTST